MSEKCQPPLFTKLIRNEVSNTMKRTVKLCMQFVANVANNKLIVLFDFYLFKMKFLKIIRIFHLPNLLEQLLVANKLNDISATKFLFYSMIFF